MFLFISLHLQDVEINVQKINSKVSVRLILVKKKMRKISLKFYLKFNFLNINSKVDKNRFVRNENVAKKSLLEFCLKSIFLESAL